MSANDLVKEILGGGVKASNVQFTGVTQGQNNLQASAAVFSGGKGILDTGSPGNMSCGIILSTGAASLVVGPNNSPSATQSDNTPGDPQLESLVPGITTHDATSLSFDFVPQSSQITFRYVFGSEEYNEYAGSSFNDVFGFFLNGKNVALLPNSNTPVSINSVNATVNSQFYVNNDPVNAPTVPTANLLNTQLDGLTVVLTVTAQVNAGVTNHIKLAIANGSDQLLDSDVFIQAGSFSSGATKPAVTYLVTGTDAGVPSEVKVYDPSTLQVKYDIRPFDPAFLGGVRVAVGDVNGDGTQDIICAAGPGGGPQIKVYDGATGQLIFNFFAYDSSFRDGVFVASGDTTGSGHDDIITGPDAGGGPQVKVFSGTDLSLLQNFYAFDPNFRGGARVGSGDVNGDGLDDVIVGAGPGGAPHVKVFSSADGSILDSFYAYDPSVSGGVYVAGSPLSLDCNGVTIGLSKILVGAGAGEQPTASIFDSTGKVLRTILVDLNASTGSGVHVAAVDVNSDMFPDIITSFGTPGGSTVQAFDFANSQAPVLTSFAAISQSSTSGVFVAGR